MRHLAFYIGFLSLGLLFLEFIYPMGFFGLLCIGCLIGSIFNFFFSSPSFYWIVIYIATLLTLSLLMAIAGLFLVRRKISLKEHQKGFQASTFDKTYIGQVGIALTDLRPIGYVFINHQRLQAVSEIGYISQKTEVQIVGGQGACLIVIKRGGLCF